MASASLPSGVVTFVFTDLEGSTRLYRTIGERYPPLLARHRDLLRSAWSAHDGHEVKTEGDSFLVAFTDPADAIRACAMAQRLVTREGWPADAVLRVRMGVHSGLASPADGDYIAYAVHQAARVVDAGHGGHETGKRGGEDQAIHGRDITKPRPADKSRRAARGLFR